MTAVQEEVVHVVEVTSSTSEVIVTGDSPEVQVLVTEPPEQVEASTVTESVVEVATPGPIGPPGPEGPVGPAGDVVGLEDHIQDVTPHPTYDDIPSLTLLFENGLI